MSPCKQNGVVRKVQSRSKLLPRTHPAEINKVAQETLERYSHIPVQDIAPHVERVREEAWQIFPYPCVGQFHFLDPVLLRHPRYNEVLGRIKGDQTLLDLGCGFAQSVRRLVYDGAPAQNIYAVDLKRDFIDLGFELFRDRDSLHAHFLVADIFDESESNELAEVEESIDIIWAFAFFHLWNLDEQRTAGTHAAHLLKRRKGSMIIGGQAGHIIGGEYPASTASGKIFFHDVQTFKKMWTEIGEVTDMKFKIDVTVDDQGVKELQEGNPGVRRLVFSIEVVQVRFDGSGISKCIVI